MLRLALSWITKCDEECTSAECEQAKERPKRYPTRLIDLRQLKSGVNRERGRVTGTNSRSFETTDVAKVTLVDTGTHFNDRDPPESNSRYVSLSHCWGKEKERQPYTLKPETEAQLRAGIELSELPKTFQDAMRFAAQLHNVGWIWIDSLCIIQEGPDHEQDWLRESARMQEVYKEAYLNISATAAYNSGEGLYYQRQPKILWEDEVNLNVDGIPGLKNHKDKQRRRQEATSHGWARQDVANGSFADTWVPFKWLRSSSSHTSRNCKAASTTAQLDWVGGKQVVIPLPKPEGIRRCVLIDASYWDKLVNRAPVNCRAWVLQERLMAPRVLHFCKNQIAWECSTFAAAEGHPAGVPKFELREDRILPEIPVKGLHPMTDGRQLRKFRLEGAPEPDSHLPQYDLYAFELWARVVETYSRLHLTNSRDKLIALSGIAQHMSRILSGSEIPWSHLEGPVEYVAGLWDKYLESQLLWRIEPVFQHSNSTFQHLSHRPKTLEGAYFYRAPSFSWASVDAQDGHGVTYGEVTDRDLLIKVASAQDCAPESPVSVQINETGNRYGLVSGGHIMLWCRLRRIKIYQADPPAAGRFYWHLVDRAGLDKEEHRNVYLDCPGDDQDRYRIFNVNNTYCVPAAYSERKEAEGSKSIVCLLLQQATEDDQVQHLDPLSRDAVFRRIGVAKLSQWADKLAHPGAGNDGIIKPDRGLDMDLPHWPHSYREATGEHLIRII